MSVVGDELRKVFASPTLTAIARQKIAPTALRIIDERTRKGRFLVANTPGYSTKPLALNVVGQITPLKSGLRFRSIELNKTLNFKKSDYGWRTLGGKRYALLWGGYKKIREASGRNTSFVDLTFTGRMLNSLSTRAFPVSERAVAVEVTVGSDQQDKARFTHAKRPWLGLTDREADEIGADVKRAIDVLVKQDAP